MSDFLAKQKPSKLAKKSEAFIMIEERKTNSQKVINKIHKAQRF